MGSPAISTFLDAIRKGWIKARGLTSKIVSRNPPLSLHTAFGHLDVVRQGLRSSRIPPPSKALAVTRSPPPPPPSHESPKDFWDSLTPADPASPPFTLTVPRSSCAASDLTGRLPHLSRKGNQYILVTHFCGYIHFTPQASKTPTSCLSSFRSIVDFFSSHGHPLPQLIMDNETSEPLRSYFRSISLPVQFVPPGVHRTLTAERCIRNGKNHLISTFSSTHPDFPPDLWG